MNYAQLHQPLLRKLSVLLAGCSHLTLTLTLVVASVFALTLASYFSWSRDPELFLSRTTLGLYEPTSPMKRKRPKQQHPAVLSLARENEHPNPFVSSSLERPPPSRFDKLKLAAASCTLIPIRVVIFGLLLLLAWFVALVGLLGAPSTGMTATRPLGPIRRLLLSPIRPIFRAMLFTLGYYTLSQKGRPAPRDKSRIVVCNHISFVDSMIMVASLECSFIGAAHWTALPIVGRIGQALHSIGVDLSLSTSRGDVLRAISERARSDLPWPPLVIYPEVLLAPGCEQARAAAPVHWSSS